MRFGHFFLPVSLDPADDFRLIDDCLYEAEMVEELGWDAIWLSEHHFGGETAYADPLVFGGAVAAKTKRVQLGFSVVELELHNPVRLAIQTALVDNISRGRLVVGLGRGSRYNVFEYKGFGTTMEAGRDHLEEAEDLLIKAWTTDSLDYAGKYWQVSFPFIRPRPYQQPHPPLARACATDQSVVEMARIARPILLYCPTIHGVKHSLDIYRDAMFSAGFDEPTVEEALSRSWVWRDTYVAETDDRAMDEYLPAFDRAVARMNDLREQWNPKDMDIPKRPAPLPKSNYEWSPLPNTDELMVGSPRRVAEHVALLRDAGARNLIMTHRNLLPREESTNHIRLFSDKIMPLFRDR